MLDTWSRNEASVGPSAQFQIVTGLGTLLAEG